MSRLNQLAFNDNFCDRIADLALAQKSAALPYRAVFNAAKGVVDPLAAGGRRAFSAMEGNALKATGEDLYRGGGSSNMWTALKSTILPGFGQMKEMHGIRNDYMGDARRLAGRIKGIVPGASTKSDYTRASLIAQMKDLTSQFRAEKERGFTAIGATAQPRINAAKMALPAIGAAGIAGGAGLWAGNEQNQSDMRDLLQNQTLMERLKYVMFPRQQIRKYLLGEEQAKQSSHTKCAIEESLPLSTFGLSGLARAISPSQQDQLHDRNFINRFFRGSGRDTLTGVGGGAGLMAGAGMGGGIGHMLGTLLKKNPETGMIAGALGGAFPGLMYGLNRGYQWGGGGPQPLSFMDKLRLGIKQSSEVPIAERLIKRLVLPTLGAGLGGAIRTVDPSNQDMMHDRGMFNRLIRGLGRGALTGAGVGAGGELGYRAGSRMGASAALKALAQESESKLPLVGSEIKPIVAGGGILGGTLGGGAGALTGGIAGHMLGGMDDNKPGLMDRLRFGMRQAKNASEKRALNKWEMMAEAGAIGAGGLRKIIGQAGHGDLLSRVFNPENPALRRIVRGGLAPEGARQMPRMLMGTIPESLSFNPGRFGSPKQAGIFSELGGAAGSLLGAGIKKLPVLGGFAKDVISDSAGRISQTGGAAAGRMGMAAENLGGAADVRGRQLFRPFRNWARGVNNQAPLPTHPFLFVPKTKPTFYSRALGTGVAGVGLMGAGVGAGMYESPEYRGAVGQTFRHPYDNIVKPTYNAFTSPAGRDEIGNDLGLPMSETGPDSQWHRPAILGGWE